jgi:uncharacterized protein (TIGR03086 family)
MDDVATMKRVVAEIDRAVGAVGDDQWAAPTPCTDWTVRDLVNHMTGGGLLFAACVRDGSIADDRLVALMTEDQLGDDPAGAWSAAAQDAVEAFEQCEGDPMVTLPFGTLPASIALNVAIFDLMVHAVDLVIATGQDLDSLDPELVAIALEMGPNVMPDEHRAPGIMDPARAVGDGEHPAKQLAAFAGRAV